MNATIRIAGRTLYSAWVTYPDGHRELIVESLDYLDALHRAGCDIELND